MSQGVLSARSPGQIILNRDKPEQTGTSEHPIKNYINTVGWAWHGLGISKWRFNQIAAAIVAIDLTFICVGVCGCIFDFLVNFIVYK